MVWRLPLAQGAILEARDRIPHRAPGAWSLLLPLPVSLPLNLPLTFHFALGFTLDHLCVDQVFYSCLQNSESTKGAEENFPGPPPRMCRSQERRWAGLKQSWDAGVVTGAAACSCAAFAEAPSAVALPRGPLWSASGSLRATQAPSSGSSKTHVYFSLAS